MQEISAENNDAEAIVTLFEAGLLPDAIPAYWEWSKTKVHMRVVKILCGCYFGSDRDSSYAVDFMIKACEGHIKLQNYQKYPHKVRIVEWP